MTAPQRSRRTAGKPRPGRRAAKKTVVDGSRPDGSMPHFAGITAYTDGSCSGAVGAGGWGMWVDQDLWAAGFQSSTTAQRMEVLAVTYALEVAPLHQPLRVVSDSQYTVNSMSSWMHEWVKRDWRTKSGSSVAHRDLFERALAALGQRTQPVSFVWVRGHQGVEGNELADGLACAARDWGKSQPGLTEGLLPDSKI